MLYSRSLLVIYFIYSSVYMLIPNSILKTKVQCLSWPAWPTCSGPACLATCISWQMPTPHSGISCNPFASILGHAQPFPDSRSLPVPCPHLQGSPSCFPGWLHILQVFSQTSLERHNLTTLPKDSTLPISLSHTLILFCAGTIPLLQPIILHLFIC